MFQRSSAPGLSLFAGGAGTARDANLPLGVFGVVVALFNSTLSKTQVNRFASVGGDAGTQGMGGVTLGASGTTVAAFANVTTSELTIYSEAHNAATQNLVVNYLATKFGISL